jgi:hypothetical protein
MSYNSYLEKLLTEDKDEIKPKLITTTYSKVTPGEEDDDEYDEEHGFIDEDGENMNPDEYEIEDNITAIDIAVKFMKDKNGAYEASSSRYSSNTWYTNPEYDEDFSTGAKEKRSYFLHSGWTDAEKEEIFNRMTKRG